MTAPLRYPIPSHVAAMALDRHHVVEASAGTGKTFLIEHRVADLLLRGGAAIEDLLLVTFTEKATSDLRRRVRGLLARLHAADPAAPPAWQAVDDRPAWVLDGAARARLGVALRGFDRATVATIHGFCQRVLGDAAFESGRPFQQRQVASEGLFRAAFRDALRDELATDPAALELMAAWRRAHRPLVDPDRADHALVGKLYIAWARRAASAEPFDRPRFAAALAALGDAAAAADDAALDDGVASVRHASTRRAIRERLARARELGLRHRIGGEVAALLDELASGAKLDFLIGKPGATGAAAALQDAALAAHAAAVPLVTAAIEGLLPAVAARLEHAKLRHGLFDYDDMLVDVWRALDGAGGDALAARLRARHRFALIDEFQDTDPIQWQIFRRLYLEGDGGRLTVVGDPKQAIYGFRGADLATYLAACRELASAGAQTTALDTSYRSTPAVVEACDVVFREDYFRELSCPRLTAGSRRALLDDGGRPLPAVVLHPLGGGARAAMVERIAAEIGALLARPPTLVEPHGARPLRAGDVFVLTRSTDESNEVAGALRAAGLPCALYQQEGLFQTDEAREVVDLLAAIEAPRDLGLRRRALATRFFDVGLGELAALDRAGDDHPYVARLLGWKRLAERRSYEELFARVLDDSRVAERELLCAASERGLTNLGHVLEAVLEATLERRPELGELVAELGRNLDTADAFADPRNVQRRETDRDAVQIMTIHRAKGLEAAVVFLHGGLNGGARWPYVFHGASGERRRGDRSGGVHGAAIEREARAENERLYYVALTRAVGQLHLPWPEACSGPYQVVAARLEGLAEREELAAVRRAAPAAVAVGSGDPFEGWRPAEALGRVIAGREGHPLVALGRERHGPVATSYTRLTRGGRAGEDVDVDVDVHVHVNEDAHAHAHEDVDEDEDVHEVGRGLPAGRETGIYLHELLERVEMTGAGSFEQWCADRAVGQVFERVMRRHGRSVSELAASQGIVWRALTAAIDLAPVVRLGEVGPSAREVEFSFPVGPQGDEAGFVRGAIDLVFEHAGKIWWLDWKSDVLEEYAPAALARHVGGAYAVQAALYGIAVARMVGVRSRAEHEARIGGLVYFFLRGGVAHVARPGWDELVAAEAALPAQLAAARAAGDAGGAR